MFKIYLAAISQWNCSVIENSADFRKKTVKTGYSDVISFLISMERVEIIDSDFYQALHIGSTKSDFTLQVYLARLARRSKSVVKIRKSSCKTCKTCSIRPHLVRLARSGIHECAPSLTSFLQPDFQKNDSGFPDLIKKNWELKKAWKNSWTDLVLLIFGYCCQSIVNFYIIILICRFALSFSWFRYQ